MQTHQWPCYTTPCFKRQKELDLVIPIKAAPAKSCNMHDIDHQVVKPESMSEALFLALRKKRANNEIFETALQWACAEGCVCAFRCQHRGTWYISIKSSVNQQPLQSPLHPSAF